MDAQHSADLDTRYVVCDDLVLCSASMLPHIDPRAVGTTSDKEHLQKQRDASDSVAYRQPELEVCIDCLCGLWRGKRALFGMVSATSRCGRCFRGSGWSIRNI